MSELKCNMCNDTGICSSCKGKGTIQGERRCEMCNGTGICLCREGIFTTEHQDTKIFADEPLTQISNAYTNIEIDEVGDIASSEAEILEASSVITQPTQPITLERLREKVDSIPTQRRSITGEDYLRFVRNKLKGANFGIQFDFNAFPQLIASKVMSIGWYPLPVLLAVGYVENIDITLIQNLNHDMREIARRIRKERNNLVIVALCSENITPEIIKWISRVTIPKVHNYHSLPVVFDLSNQEIHYNRERGMWGSQVYSRMKYVIGKYLDRSPQAKDLKQPKGLEIFMCIICTIMLVCLVIMLIL